MVSTHVFIQETVKHTTVSLNSFVSAVNCENKNSGPGVGKEQDVDYARNVGGGFFYLVLDVIQGSNISAGSASHPPVPACSRRETDWCSLWITDLQWIHLVVYAQRTSQDSLHTGSTNFYSLWSGGLMFSSEATSHSWLSEDWWRLVIYISFP